ncbi:MAG: class I SAM-dependent methyltransferase [Luminiphilus sp.]|nr:class I SAM-dependent methyltransferase [Luminiphilus sp.]
MIALWQPIMQSLVDAIGAKTILEVGAESGLSTKVLLDYVKGVGGHLHSIDPAPDFSTDDLAQNHPEALTFYRELSLDAIPKLPHIDVALLDGDHNWYTVLNELRLLENLHNANPCQMPLIFLHDIGWPYARRDLYYAPETIPEKHRNPYAKLGMGRLKKKLLESGGLNATLHNALTEGGPHNGVLTGLEDYLRESKLNFLFMNLPLYFGLGVLVTQERIAANSSLKTELAKLKTYLAGEKLIDLTERFRLKTVAQLQSLQLELAEARTNVACLQNELASANQRSD